MRIALVDDRPDDLSLISARLDQYAGDRGLRFELEAFSSGEALLRGYRPRHYDLLFLDIFMDGMTGIDAARRVRAVDDDTCIVFLTTSDEHQAEAIHLNVYDYLKKGADPSGLWAVMDRIMRRQKRRTAKYLSFVSHKVEYNLPYDDITYVSAERNYLSIHDNRGNEHKARMTFSAAEELLSQDARFLTVLRGVLVNMDYITDVTGSTCSLRGNVHLPISMRNSGRIEQCWTNYTFFKIRSENAEGTR